jgi:hypothetical protein
MGLFKKKKKTYVASTCYNLAGDEAERPDYLKSVVLGAAIAGDPKASLGDAIRDGYLGGPGMKMRAYYRWAQSDYADVIGFSSSGMASAPDVSPSSVADSIPVDPGKTISVQSIHVGPADLEIWAEQWMLENAPAVFNEEWEADFDETSGQIVITMPDTSVVSFTPTNFDKAAVYISATYNEVQVAESLPTVTGSVVTLLAGDAFPSTSGWTEDSFTSTPRTVPEPWTETHRVSSKTQLLGDDGSGVVYSRHSVMYQDQLGHDDGTGHVVLDRTYRIDTTDTIVVGYSPLRVFIYKVGSGVALLDDQITDTSGWVSDFLPPIPVRVDNQFISDSYLPTQYEWAKKAYKKLMNGGKFDELVDNLAENPDLGDLDYVYVVPGVSLNVAEMSARRYIYNFFSRIAMTAVYAESAYNQWGDNVEEATIAQQIFAEWLSAQDDPGNPLAGTSPPSTGVYTPAASNEILVKATSDGLSYDTRISWQSIKEDAGSGLSRPGAKKGDVWLTTGTTSIFGGEIYGGVLGYLEADTQPDDLIIYWQLSASSWKRIRVRGLVHRNFIYGGKFVEITAKDALEDLDESGFIIPIHYDTMREMSARDCAQMTTASLFLVINCYQVVKQKWYQTGLFKIFVIVLIVALTIIFPPAGLAGASALTIAVITLTSILISMILFKIVQVVAIEAFGRKVGNIVAIVATFLIMNPEMLSQSIGQNLATLAQADNLMRLTSAVGQTVSDMIMQDAQGAFEKAQGILSDYEIKSKEISDMAVANLNSDFSFDVMRLTDAAGSARFVAEPSNIFLTRTLMTGSDIAELSLGLVSDFTSLTLNMELPV